MLPHTEIRGNYARVPPIYNTPNCGMSVTQTTGSITIPQTITSRRGRRSDVPPEIREQTRRLKKQNMERKRRACISDKMNALHNLAMNLIGIDPNECHKVEKADILNLCHNVFKGIASIAKDEPELQTRLRKLRHNLTDSFSTSVSHASTSFTTTNDFNEIINKTTEWDHGSHSQDKYIYDIHQSSQCQDNQRHSNNTVSLFSTPTICNSLSQIADETNKENKIPKLIIKNPLSCKNYTTTNQRITSSAITTPDSLKLSDPLNSLYPDSMINSRNNERISPWRSTPLQNFNKSSLTLNNSDSGFLSSSYSNRSMEITPNGKKIGVYKDHHKMKNIVDLSIDSTESSSMVSYSNAKNVQSSQLTSKEHLSAFSVPTRKVSGVITTESTGSNFTFKDNCNQDHKQIMLDLTVTTTPEIIATPIKTASKPMWRPYLD
ncbi:hypothetical protein EWB00_004253 [Schistosoma japonicum]|uniref:BHLH domain-containing protein n=1 Tax=Schistosoma japonicum TaxID=6182 RepID=A0A4Z2D5G2_SCHJA|nr:hypothetical protein EWB00_004253 [Schistosoma japonicum]